MRGREQLGPFALSTPEGVFPVGSDALALGDFATVRPGMRVCDLGTGSGVLLLLLAAREKGLLLTGIELDAASARTARENLRENQLPGTVLEEDLRKTGLPAGSFDLVISNPPYFSPKSGKSGGPFRSEENCSLEELCATAARLLKNGGRFALCHRPERLTDVLCTLREKGLEPKRLQSVCHTPSHGPSVVLVEAVRQGRPGLEILPVRLHTPERGEKTLSEGE